MHDFEPEEDHEELPDIFLPEPGSLLIAHPNLHDPNFRRTVVYLPAYDPENGAMGLVINRPTGATAGEMLPEMELGKLADVPVFIGGPVATNSMSFTALRTLWDEDSLAPPMRHLSVQEAIDLHDDPTYILRAYLGYAGWSGGQLEGELSHSAWLLRSPEPDDLHFSNPLKLWHQLVGTFGPVYKLMAQAPDDPSLN
jgi:putative transcriptional regulator